MHLSSKNTELLRVFQKLKVYLFQIHFMNILKADIPVFLTLLHYSRQMFLVPSLLYFNFYLQTPYYYLAVIFFIGKSKQMDEGSGTCNFKKRKFCVVMETESAEVPEYAYFST